MMGCGGFGPGCGKGTYKPTIPIDTGELRHRIIIQTPYLVRDNRGGGVYEWTNVATVWAYIKTYSASDFKNRERFESAQIRSRNEFLITMRYIPDTITTKMRVLFREISLEILAITNVNVLNWTMELYVREDGLGEQG